MEHDLGVAFGALAFCYGVAGLFGYLLQILSWGILSTCIKSVPRPTWPAMGMGLLGMLALALVAVLISLPLSDYLEAHKLGFWMIGAGITLGVLGATGGACLPVPEGGETSSEQSALKD